MKIGRVSMVVETGLSDQLLNDTWIRYEETENPKMTARIQKSRENLLVATM